MVADLRHGGFSCWRGEKAITRQHDKMPFCRFFAFDCSPRQHEKAKIRNFRGNILYILTHFIKCRPFAPPTRKDEVKTFRPFVFRYSCAHHMPIPVFSVKDGWISMCIFACVIGVRKRTGRRKVEKKLRRKGDNSTKWHFDVLSGCRLFAPPTQKPSMAQISHHIWLYN